MKVQHVSYSDSEGGAARAAYRIHEAVRHVGVESELLVKKKKLTDCDVTSPVSMSPLSSIGDLLYRTSKAAVVRVVCESEGLVSPALLGSAVGSRLQRSVSAVVNLHWVQGGTLSIKDIAMLKAPVVWTLHDLWPLLGWRHYPEDRRWFIGCGDEGDRQPAFLEGIIDEWCWRRKSAWDISNMTLVAPSLWMKQQALESRLFCDAKCFVIPNPLDKRVWKPQNKVVARRSLGIPEDRNVILFISAAGGADTRKGFSFLKRVFASDEFLSKSSLLCLIGRFSDVDLQDVPVEFVAPGPVLNDTVLRDYYAACDVTVVPSEKEVFGQTASESQMCARPVVCSDSGGLKEVVMHGVTGFVCPSGHEQEFAQALKTVLSGESRASLGDMGRYHAERRYS